MAYPKLLHHNIIAQAASVVASSTASGMAVANLSDGRPYTWWGPSAAPASIEVDAGVATEADFLYIPSHTLDSTLWDVSLYAADLPFSGMQLLTAPEDFSNAAWTKNDATVTVNATTAPDGTATADKLVEGTGVASTHYSTQSASGFTAGQAVTASVYVKPGERTKCWLRIFAGGAISVTRYITVDLATGAVTGTSGTLLGYGISAVEANGFYRLWLSVACDVSGNVTAGLMLVDGAGSNTYTGDGASGLYPWGAMLNAGSTPAPYIPQTAGRWISEAALCYSNRIPSPRNLTVGVGTSGATILAAQAYAPNGLKEMALVTDTSAALGIVGWPSGGYAEYHNAESGLGASIFVRKTVADTAYAALSVVILTGAATTEQLVIINTNTGQISAASPTLLGYGIEDAGDCWWVWLRGAAGTDGNSKAAAQFYPAWNTTGTLTSSAAATGSKYIWGGDLGKSTGRPAPYRTDAPIFLPFTATTKRYWLLRLNRKSGSALCAMSVCMIGKALTMPTGLPQGYDPVGRKVVGQRNRNERGQPLGTAVDYKWRRQTLRFQAVLWAWVRGVFARLWDNGLASEPVGFIWDYEAHVEDVQHVTLGEEFRTPHKSGQLCDLEFDVEGVVE